MENGFEVVADIQYGGHERQKFDIFVPEKTKSENGIILFIHGGGWSQGDKEAHHKDCEYFCRLGYLCITMNYRYVSEELSVFDELDDITSALKKIKTECVKYGVNAENVILSGGSAGAHLSLLYAYTRSDETPLKIVAACVWCPPVNCYASDFIMGISGEFEDWKYGILSMCCAATITKNNFSDEVSQNALKKMSPEEYIGENKIPVAIFQGVLDTIVPYVHIQRYIEKLNEKGIKNELVVYENSDHALDKDPESAQKARYVMQQYAEMYL